MTCSFFLILLLDGIEHPAGPFDGVTVQFQAKIEQVQIEILAVQSTNIYF
jgi:hypothetical protein